MHINWLCVKPDGFVAETVLLLRMSKICPDWVQPNPKGCSSSTFRSSGNLRIPLEQLVVQVHFGKKQPTEQSNELIFLKLNVLKFPSCRKLCDAMFWLLYKMKTCLEMQEFLHHRTERPSFYQLLQNCGSLWQWRLYASSVPQGQEKDIIKLLNQTISQLLL